jgi:hypothetical protein
LSSTYQEYQSAKCRQIKIFRLNLDEFSTAFVDSSGL